MPEEPPAPGPEGPRRLRRALRHVLPPAAALAVWGVDTESADLLPAEAEAVARAIPERRLEFARGRACARAALRELGRPPVPIPVGPGRAPVWPEGCVGSITHAGGLVAAAVASVSALPALGIDAETRRPLDEGVRALVLNPGEDRPDHDFWANVVFSAKESVFKALYPEVREWIAFEAVSIVPGSDPAALRAVAASDAGNRLPLDGLQGAFALSDDQVVTGFWRPASA